ncbi:ionotropic receptor 93a-like [Scylla paramamosain]|uniref:ionotropic receptor 93a-like n=1 Tax=Scylla paramamosain TaxID=85552 RepID=UPI003082729B
MMGMLLGQNLPRRLPTTSSSRILVGTWLMFALVIGLAYRGNLTASLTLPKYPPRPETLSQLVDTVDRITMQPYGVEFRNFFAKSDSPVFQKLARLIAFVPTIEIGQNEAVEKNQAHLENKRYQQLRIAERFTKADGSELLYIGRESIMPGQAAWPLPHDAPYRPLIDRHLMAIVEGGLYEKWSEDLLLEVQMKSRRKQKQLQEDNKTVQKNENTVTALTITHTQGAFMLLHLGQAIAALLLAAELLTWRTTTKIQ